MPRNHRPLDTPDFALLDRLVRRMVADGQVSDDVRRAVDVLTSSAAPDRAERLVVRPGEPPAIVERLAVWALPRTTSAAVAAATRSLDGEDVPGSDMTPDDDRLLAGSAAR